MKGRYQQDVAESEQAVNPKTIKRIKTYSNMASADMLALSSNQLLRAKKMGGSILKIGISAGKSIKALSNLITETDKKKDVRMF